MEDYYLAYNYNFKISNTYDKNLERDDQKLKVWAKLSWFSEFRWEPCKFFQERFNNYHCNHTGQCAVKIFPQILHEVEIAKVYPNETFPIYGILLTITLYYVCSAMSTL